MTEGLEAARRRSDELDELGSEASVDEVVQANKLVFDADPSSMKQCNRLASALEWRDDEGDLERAHEALKRGLSEEPEDGFERGLGTSMLERIERELDMRRHAGKIFVSAFEGLDERSREECILLMDMSIAAIEAVAPASLGVAEIQDRPFFRIWCGVQFACTLGDTDGQIDLRLHRPSSQELIDRIIQAGGQVHGSKKTAVRNGEWVGIPINRLPEYRDQLTVSHRRIVQEASETSKNPHARDHHRRLRDYIVREARRIRMSAGGSRP